MRVFIPAIALLGIVSLVGHNTHRREAYTSSFDNIRRAGKLHVEVLSCTSETCQLQAGGQTRTVISTEQHAPGPGLAVLHNQAGQLSLIRFQADNQSSAVGIVEDLLYVEGLRLVEVNGITYQSENCKVGQMAISQSSSAVYCPNAHD